MSLGKHIDNLTGLQVKRVEQITGSVIHEPDDYYETLFAVVYVERLDVEQLKRWGPDEVAGFADMQATTKVHEIVSLLKLDDDDAEDSAPKDETPPSD